MELDKLEKLIVSMDMDENGGLNFEDFKRASAAGDASGAVGGHAARLASSGLD